MAVNLNLHHCAYRVVEGGLDFVIELLQELNFVLAEKHPSGQAAWLYQKGKNFVLQFSETDQNPLPTETKRNTHFAFISKTPKQELEKLKAWIQSKGVRVVEGSWSAKEFYLDCPEIFVDFVIEIMHQSVAGVN